MRIFITGATGVIGRRVVHDRLERGDEVVALTRDAQRGGRRLSAADAFTGHEIEMRRAAANHATECDDAVKPPRGGKLVDGDRHFELSWTFTEPSDFTNQVALEVESQQPWAEFVQDVYTSTALIGRHAVGLSHPP